VIPGKKTWPLPNLPIDLWLLDSARAFIDFPICIRVFLVTKTWKQVGRRKQESSLSGFN